MTSIVGGGGRRQQKFFARLSNNGVSELLCCGKGSGVSPKIMQTSYLDGPEEDVVVSERIEGQQRFATAVKQLRNYFTLSRKTPVRIF